MTIPGENRIKSEHNKWIVTNIQYKLQAYQDEITRAKDIGITTLEVHYLSTKENRNRLIGITTFIISFLGFNTLFGNLILDYIFLLSLVIFFVFIFLVYIYYSIKLKHMNDIISQVNLAYLVINARLDFFKGFISNFAIYIEKLSKSHLEYINTFLDLINMNRLELIATLQDAIKYSPFKKSKSDLEDIVKETENTMITHSIIYNNFPKPSSMDEAFTILDPWYNDLIKPVFDEYKNRQKTVDNSYLQSIVNVYKNEFQQDIKKS